MVSKKVSLKFVGPWDTASGNLLQNHSAIFIAAGRAKKSIQKEMIVKRILKVGLFLILVAMMSFMGAVQDAQAEEPYTYDGYASQDDYVRRYLDPWWGATEDNVVGNVCGDYQGHGMAMRFEGVNIPAGAIIQQAYLEMTFIWVATSDGLQGTKSWLRCEDAYNPSPISSYDDHVGRLRTQWGYYWVNPPEHTEDIVVQSPDFSLAIQEVVDKHNGTGDALIVFWEDPDMESNDGRHRHVASVENLDYPPAMLHIEYLAKDEPAPPLPPPTGIELEIRQIENSGSEAIMDIASVKYPYVPVYKLTIGWPATEGEIKAAILDAEPDIQAHIDIHAQTYDFFNAAGLLRFNTNDLR